MHFLSLYVPASCRYIQNKIFQIVHVSHPLVPNKPGYYKYMNIPGTLLKILTQFLYNNYGKPKRSNPNESSWPKCRNPGPIYILFPSVMITSPDKPYFRIQRLNITSYLGSPLLYPHSQWLRPLQLILPERHEL